MGQILARRGFEIPGKWESSRRSLGFLRELACMAFETEGDSYIVAKEPEQLEGTSVGDWAAEDIGEVRGTAQDLGHSPIWQPCYKRFLGEEEN